MYVYTWILYYLSIWWYDDPVVKIQQGIIKGSKLTTRKGREIFGFQGIPYAEPPIADLRFRSPVPKKPWNGVLSANKSGSKCLQFKNNDVEGSEDCLYVNVYTPWLSKDKELLPVIFYIPGGGYVKESGNIDDYEPDYFLDKDIILVTLNYRLGIFGFMSTGDLAAPGNYGLKDQLLALQWVKENIREFQGDPDRVTLFGLSAGAACVNLHALSDKSKDLFQRYIIQSGPVLAAGKFRYPKSYYEKTLSIISKFNCSRNNSFAMIDCLRQLDSVKLLSSFYMFDFLDITVNAAWGPTIEPDYEGAFMSKNPAQLIMENKMKDCPFISGTVRDEGLLLTMNLYKNSSLYDLFVKNPKNMIKRYLNAAGPFPGDDKIVDEIMKYFLGEKMPNDKEKVRQGYTDLFGDILFLYPQYKTMEYNRLAKRKSPVYFYSFEYRGTFSVTSSILNNTNIGVAHADDFFYMFPKNRSKPENLERNEKDFQVVDLMIDLLTTFAATGIPDSILVDEDNKWKSYTSNKSILRIGSDGNTSAVLTHGFLVERMEFWTKTAPNYPETPEIINSK